jgi:hypothetical protein
MHDQEDGQGEEMSRRNEVWFRYRRWHFFAAFPWVWPIHWKGRLLWLCWLLTTAASMVLTSLIISPKDGTFPLLAGVLASVPFFWVGKRHAQFYDGPSPLEELRSSLRKDD